MVADGAVFNVADGDSNGLIAAINLANSNGEPDVINLATNGTYVLRRIVHTEDFIPGECGTDENGLPPVVSEIAIHGFGASIARHDADGAREFRILQIGDVNTSGNLSVHGVTLAGGRHWGCGGAVAVYSGKATFADCELSGNLLFAGAHGGYGGAIYNLGECELRNCTLRGNRATSWCWEQVPPCGGTGLPSIAASGIYNRGTLHVESCEFTEQATFEAIYNELGGQVDIIESLIRRGGRGVVSIDGITTISDSSISSNGYGAINSGHMVVNRCAIVGNKGGLASDGELTLTDSDISENYDHTQELGSRGGMTLAGIAGVERTRISNNRSNDGEIAGGITVKNNESTFITIGECEISGNHSEGYGGGVSVLDFAILLDSPAVVDISNTTISNNSSRWGGGLTNIGGIVSLTNSTVAENASPDGGGLYVRGAAWPDAWDTLVTLQNSIIADAHAGAGCAVGGGAIVSRGHNLDSDGTCNLDSNGDISFGFANLGPLADNGGPTWTRALLPRSDAIDAGSSGVCLADPVGGVDQRGYPRPQGLACDIGAFEVGDFDDDGVIDGVDVCLSPAGAVVNNAGGPLGDINDDCAVTLADFVYFEVCLYLSGPEVSPLFSDCAAVFDFDDDGDVDLVDYAFMQTVM
ncbi:MAG: hypothetical protein H6817_09700 [Phycisphaerales bacterium]|nr:hypothetical protein [Phycisphaerales bacterium]